MTTTVKQLIGQFIGLFVVTSLALFIPAGTLGWLNGWLFLVLFFGFFLTVELWLSKHNPGLLKERMHFGTHDQEGLDKIIFPVLLLLPFVQFIFSSLDVNRFHWSSVRIEIQMAGSIILLFSFYLFFLTFRENSYLSTVVRIQADRGHQVISTGPYQYVRHPMYTGFVAFVVGTPLVLGSWYGIAVGLPLIIILMRRAVLEESILREQLNGYEDYKAKVKFRLIPYIW